MVSRTLRYANRSTVVVNQSASSTDRIEASPELADDIEDTEDEDMIEERTLESILAAAAATSAAAAIAASKDMLPSEGGF